MYYSHRLVVRLSTFYQLRSHNDQRTKLTTTSGTTMLKKFTFIFSTFLVTSLALSTQSHARGIDIKLADEMGEFTYLSESSTFGYGGADVGVGLLFTEADDVQFNFDVMVTGNPAGNNKALQFGVGAKAVFTSFDILDEEVGAVAIGGQVRYVIASSTPIAFLATGHYAPGITSFSGAEQYTEFRFAIELEVTPSARAFVGYRNIEYELEGGAEVELDDGAHVGVKFEF